MLSSISKLVGLKILGKFLQLFQSIVLAGSDIASTVTVRNMRLENKTKVHSELILLFIKLG